MIVSLGNMLCALLSRVREEAFAPRLDVFQKFWIGLGFLIAILQLYSLFLPIDGTCLAVVMLLALLGLPALARRISGRAMSYRRLKGLFSRENVCYFAILGLLLVKAASSIATLAYSVAYDDIDLYHFTAVRWANEYAAVPGLANLHCRLGLNSSFLLYSALVDNWIWDLRSAWITNGLILLVGAFQWIHVIVYRRHTPLRAVLFCMFSLPYLLYWASVLSPSLYQDKPAMVVQMAMFLELLRFPFCKRGDSAFSAVATGSARIFPLCLLILTLAVIGFTFKASALLSCGMGFLFVALILLHDLRGQLQRSGSRLHTAMIAILPLCVLVGYLARNVVLSGWLFYPVPVGNLHLQWSVPRNPIAEGRMEELQSVAGLSQIIKDWARIPTPEYAKSSAKTFWDWFPVWHRTNSDRAIEFRFIYAGLVLLLAYVLLNRNRRFMWSEAFYASFILLNIIFWVATAPDIRFGAGYLWMWMAFALSSFLCAAIREESTVNGIAAIALVFLFMWINIDFTVDHRPPLWTVDRAKPMPTKEVAIENGQNPPLIVLVPSNRNDDRCGDAQLPCTPYPRNSLMMRVPGSLAHGFYVGQK
jgi:hypothetical protein